MKRLIEYLTNIYRMPSPEKMALIELEEAKRKLLEAQTGREYADSMCKFREAQIKRRTVTPTAPATKG